MAEINEMDVVQKELEENCQSAEDVFALLSKDALPEGEDGELSEEDLELVAGGMSKTKAVKVVSTAYWDLCIKKKKKTSYSMDEIMEALKICDKMNSKAQEAILNFLKKFLGLS